MAMRRSPLVIGATAAGLAAVLSFHPHTQSQVAVPAASSLGGQTSGATGGTTRTVTGNDQTIGGGSAYGDIQVRVTAAGKSIRSVGLARLNVSGPLSQQIVTNVVPQLQQQTLAAQSANIQGVSGATYTVQAYRASLQSALDQLGITNPGGSNALGGTGNGNGGLFSDQGGD
jgi:uncharacterized protein with FMN-binding domain